MQLTSPNFTNNNTIPAQFTCNGADQSPALQWADAPANTKSFVLVVRDPDAPAKEWIHWLVVNIPPNVTEVNENSVPAGGIQLTNDFGKVEWGGPCPPSGTHRYYFDVYALDIDTLSAKNYNEVQQAIQGHILAKGELMGVYAKN